MGLKILEGYLNKNTSFLSISSHYSLVHLTDQVLSLEEPVLFKGIKIAGNNSLFNVCSDCVHI